MPRVSVITPAYNCARFLGRTLRSVADQTYRDYEIIVVDDGSTDGTGELLEQWSGRVTVVSQSNAGPSAARNKAVSHSSGEYLAYLDADDRWYPTKLARQVDFLDRNPRCGLVHSDLQIIDEEDRVLQPEWHQARRNAFVHGACIRELVAGCAIQVPTVMERRSSHERAGGFDISFRQSEDYLHWIRVVLNGEAVGYLREPLAMYRWRAGSLSKNHAQMTESMIRMFEMLLGEEFFNERLGPDGVDLVHGRIERLRSELPRQYRQQGRPDLARLHAVSRIRRVPCQGDAYLELFKACVPSYLVRLLRRMRSHWQV